MSTINLETLLLGAHRLTAVWPGIAHPFKAGAEAFAIELDGKMFLFLEDDNDDYRSALGCVMVCDGAPYWNSTRINRDVLVSKATERKYGGEHDVWEFRDAITGKLGLSIGTDNIDDYYPSFVIEYHADAWNGDGSASDNGERG